MSSPPRRSARCKTLTEKGLANLNEAKRVDEFMSTPQIGTADSTSAAESPVTNLATPGPDISKSIKKQSSSAISPGTRLKATAATKVSAVSTSNSTAKKYATISQKAKGHANAMGPQKQMAGEKGRTALSRKMKEGDG